ncbi:LO4 [Rhynchobatus djiddensis adomavirus 1]|uniref:LO4 n=1 Tax=Rhynchobatus djiddensis adomavirus 1 TaxID=2175117 RepID=A0A2S1MK64_9VIRU|nr:LO4 [Rhynchobatus djiddensis adomavirus 1]AWG87401.1 LO4 [Rhynchobatus djiddensis adomavirus 1]
MAREMRLRKRNRIRKNVEKKTKVKHRAVRAKRTTRKRKIKKKVTRQKALQRNRQKVSQAVSIPVSVNPNFNVSIPSDQRLPFSREQSQTQINSRDITGRNDQSRSNSILRKVARFVAPAALSAAASYCGIPSLIPSTISALGNLHQSWNNVEERQIPLENILPIDSNSSRWPRLSSLPQAIALAIMQAGNMFKSQRGGKFTFRSHRRKIYRSVIPINVQRQRYTPRRRGLVRIPVRSIKDAPDMTSITHILQPHTHRHTEQSLDLLHTDLPSLQISDSRIPLPILTTGSTMDNNNGSINRPKVPPPPPPPLPPPGTFTSGTPLSTTIHRGKRPTEKKATPKSKEDTLQEKLLNELKQGVRLRPVSHRPIRQKEQTEPSLHEQLMTGIKTFGRTSNQKNLNVPGVYNDMTDLSSIFRSRLESPVRLSETQRQHLYI